MSLAIEREDDFRGFLLRTYNEDGCRSWLMSDIGFVLGFEDDPGSSPADGGSNALTESGLVRVLCLTWRDFPQHRARVEAFRAWLVEVGIYDDAKMAAFMATLPLHPLASGIPE